MVGFKDVMGEMPDKTEGIKDWLNSLADGEWTVRIYKGGDPTNAICLNLGDFMARLINATRTTLGEEQVDWTD